MNLENLIVVIIITIILRRMPWAGVGHGVLGVLDVQKLLLRGSRATVPGARTIPSLDAGIVIGLPATDELLRQPIRPQALVRSTDFTREGSTACDLHIWTHTHTQMICKRINPLTHKHRHLKPHEVMLINLYAGLNGSLTDVCNLT